MRVVIDGGDRQSVIVADRLAAALRAGQRACTQPAGAAPHAGDGSSPEDGAAAAVVHVDGPFRSTSPGREVSVWLRTPPAAHAGPAERRRRAGSEACADIIVDLHDPAWPVLRQVADSLASDSGWYISETRAFFALRAATWDAKFGEDLPAYAVAITQAGIPS